MDTNNGLYGLERKENGQGNDKPENHEMIVETVMKGEWRSPINEKTLSVTIMNGFFVRPKIAGIESKANKTFVVEIAISASTKVEAPFERIREINFPSFHSSDSDSRKSWTAV